MAYKKINQLGEELFTLDEVKLALGLDPENPADDEHDGYIELCIMAARERIEESTGLLLTEASMMYVNDRFEPKIELLKCPLIGVDKIEYRDIKGDMKEVNISDVIVDEVSQPARLQHKNAWPVTDGLLNSVRITYKAGYTTENVPELLKQGVMYLINHYFENRNMVVTGTIVNTVPDTADTIIKLYQIHPVV